MVFTKRIMASGAILPKYIGDLLAWVENMKHIETV